MLNESEWKKISDVLLELYATDSEQNLSKRILDSVKSLVKYSKGFVLFFEPNKKIVNEISFFEGFSEASSKKIAEYFNDKQFVQDLKGCFLISEMASGRSRFESALLQNILFDEKISSGFGISFSVNSKVVGIAVFSRTDLQPDFSRKEIYTLEVLKKHIENIVKNIQCSKNLSEAMNRCFAQATYRYSFSEREIEILKLIADGKSNAAICDTINISLSTVKKHVYNIFNKAGVNSRTQLLNLVYNMKETS